MSVPAEPTSPSPAPVRSHLSRGLVAAITALVAVAALGGAAAGVGLTARDRSDTMTGHGWNGSEESFLGAMVAHHEEAVTASRAMQRSDRPQVRALAQRIITSQTAQADRMRTWSSSWYGGASPDPGYRPMMRDLASLHGDRLDEAFLADMTHHHVMAVMMARRLLSGDRIVHRQVASLARSIIREQTAEVAEMQRWSRAWFGRTSCGAGMMSEGPMMGGSSR
ncbi:MAG: hypothetical protein JWR20_2012 [Marmoricola sp.]|nr:hypothetical protein [Marmoricola sp.]